MKKYIISVVCFFLICTLLSLHVSAATISTSFVPVTYEFHQISFSDPSDIYFEDISQVASVIDISPNYFMVEYETYGSGTYRFPFSVYGNWIDSAFFTTTGFTSYYLTVDYTVNSKVINGACRLDLLEPNNIFEWYYDFDYAIYSDYSNGRRSVTWRISDPDLYLNFGDGVNFPAVAFNLTWDSTDFDFALAYFEFYNDGIRVYREFPDSGGSDSGGSETTVPGSGGSDSGGSDSGGSDSGGSDSGGSDSGGSGSVNTTVIVNKIDSVGQLLEDLKTAGAEQIELQATQNVLISQLPDKLKNMSLGTVTRPQIPTDKLSGLQQKEDDLYGKSDQLLSDKNSVIDGDFNNYVKPSFGNSDTAHDLFFTRLFDIPWINKMVFISLWFGLGGFILRLGRKLN